MAGRMQKYVTHARRAAIKRPPAQRIADCRVITFADLRLRHDAVVLAYGTRVARQLDTPRPWLALSKVQPLNRHW